MILLVSPQLIYISPTTQSANASAVADTLSIPTSSCLNIRFQLMPSQWWKSLSKMVSFGPTRATVVYGSSASWTLLVCYLAWTLVLCKEGFPPNASQHKMVEFPFKSEDGIRRRWRICPCTKSSWLGCMDICKIRVHWWSSWWYTSWITCHKSTFGGLVVHVWRNPAKGWISP